MTVGTQNVHREGPYVPPGLLMQWHITERCNLHCTHCYQEACQREELGFDGLLRILDQFKDLLRFWRNVAVPRRVRGHVTVTGGEPFIRADFMDLLEVLASNRRRFGFAILTNGTLIDKATASRLRELGPSFVQVSIEGSRHTHDSIRGDGNFDRTVLALKHLIRQRIRTFVSFTAHRGNFREFEEVAPIASRLRVSRVWADRLIPAGSGELLRENVLSPDETREFFEIMNRARARISRRLFNRTQIAMHRALQFLAGGGKPYSCAAGDTLVTVQPNGDLYPCRRMPIRVGNLMETPLAELYYQSDLFQELRDRGRIAEACRECFYSKLCRGGLKCLSYAMTGDPFEADPGCWCKSGIHGTYPIRCYGGDQKETTPISTRAIEEVGQNE